MKKPEAMTGRQVACPECPLRQQKCFRPFSEPELAFMNGFKVGELVVDAGTSVLLQGIDSPHLYTVFSGWLFRFKTLPDGRRQILNYALPGDLLGLQSVLMDKAEHTAEALTRASLCVFARDNLWRLYEKHPELAYDITWLAAREERLLDEHLLSIGRRTAAERVAYVLLHLFERARQLGLNRGNSLRLPLTQQHLADTLGLSLVHTNKTLQQLIRRGLFAWRNGELTIRNAKALAEFANFEPIEESVRPIL
ncbi:MAG: Crp/Fnr family transcriptional regulator [Rhodospirillales bacterium]